MGLTREIYLNVLAENLFGADVVMPEPIFRARNLTAFTGAEFVNIPQAGSIPGVVADRAVLPAAVNQRTDTNNRLKMVEYTTDPYVVTNSEEFYTAYNKAQSVLGDHAGAIRDYFLQDSYFNVAPAGASRIIRTTGATGGALVPGNSTAKKKLTRADLNRAATLLDRDGVPRTNRYLVLPPELYAELMDETSVTSRDFIDGRPIMTGMLTMIAGFMVTTSNLLPIWDNQATPVVKAARSVGASGDNYAGIFFHANSLFWAASSLKAFSDMENPTYYGDIYSALIYFLAGKFRTDQKGIGAIVQLNN